MIRASAGNTVSDDQKTVILTDPDAVQLTTIFNSEVVHNCIHATRSVSSPFAITCIADVDLRDDDIAMF